MAKDSEQTSPDGQWVWDGTAWQPSAVAKLRAQTADAKLRNDAMEAADEYLEVAPVQELWAIVGKSVMAAGELTGDKTVTPEVALQKIGIWLLNATHAHMLMGQAMGYCTPEEAASQLVGIRAAKRTIKFR